MKNRIYVLLGIFAVIEIVNLVLYLHNFKNEVFLIKSPLVIALVILSGLFYYFFIFRSRQKKDFILDDIFKCMIIVDSFAVMFIITNLIFGTSLTFGQQMCAVLIPVVIIGFVYIDFLASIPETINWFQRMNRE